MAKQTREQYWFKSKKYGWGWGLPINRKGGIAFGLFLAVWLVALAWLVSTGSAETDISGRNYTIFAVILITDILGLLYVSFKYGEPPKWRWGNKHDQSDES